MSNEYTKGVSKTIVFYATDYAGNPVAAPAFESGATRYINILNPTTGLYDTPTTNLPVLVPAGSNRAELVLTAAETQTMADQMSVQFLHPDEDWAQQNFDLTVQPPVTVTESVSGGSGGGNGFYSYQPRSFVDFGDYDLRRTNSIVPPVTLDIFKKQIRVELDETYEDDLLEFILADATDYVQGLSDTSICNLVNWQLTLPCFPNGRVIYLPRPPLIAVTAINYYDTDEIVQAFTLAKAISTSPHLILDANESWPATAVRRDAVTISYNAGTADPLTARRAILLLASHWYKNREDSVEKALSTIPHGVDTLLETLRPGDEWTYPI